VCKKKAGQRDTPAAGRRRAWRWTSVFVIGAGLTTASPAIGMMTPRLQRLVSSGPRDLPRRVMVTLVRQIDPGAYTGRPAELIQAKGQLADRTQPPVVAAAGVPTRRFWIANALGLAAPAATLVRLAAMPAVATVDVDQTVRAGDSGDPVLATPAGLGPQVLGASQSLTSDAALGEAAAAPLDAIGARTAWSAFGITGAGVLVGSIDTGVDPANPDLAGKVAGWRDFVAGQSQPYDDNGHGTHTIGTMVGGDAQGAPIGVAPGARVIVAKAMGADGGGLGTNLLAAAQWMADPDGKPATLDVPAVVNNSWTADEANDTWYSQVIRTWLAIGIVPVFSAGNFGPGSGTVGSPAGYPMSVAVGAVDDAKTVASFSSRGPVMWRNGDGGGPVAGTVLVKPDLTAPGVGIVSSVGTGYLSYSGTSMASPHVAGVIALMKQARPALTGSEVEQILRTTATDLGPPGPDPDYGTGMVNAPAAVAAALGQPLPAAAKPPTAAPLTGNSTPAPRRAPALRGVHVSRARGGGRVLLIRGVVTDPARLRAVLTAGVGTAAARGPRAATVVRSAPAGRFEMRLPIAGLATGRYRLVLGVIAATGQAPGSSIARAVQISS
jgi:subtilisin family serine protease